MASKRQSEALDGDLERVICLRLFNAGRGSICDPGLRGGGGVVVWKG